MAIPAKRFTILDYETNVGFNELLEKKDSGILNLPANDTLTITADIESFVDAAIVDPIINPVSQALDSVSSAVRSTKDMVSNVVDMTTMTPKAIEKKIASVLPKNAPMVSDLTSLGILCKQKNFGLNGLGKPFDLSLDCNGRLRSAAPGCNNGQFGNILNKLTNGAYSSTMKDLNAMLNALMSLSLYGYGLNMCGVFDAAATGIGDKMILNRGAAGVATTLVNNRNSSGLFDLANTVNIKNLMPKLEAPLIGSQILTKFKIPSSTKEKELSSVNDQLFATAEIMDNSWSRSEVDDILAIERSVGYNEDLDNVMTADRYDNAVDESNLDYIPNNDSDFMSAAYSGSSDINDNFYSMEV